jgi:hypothetical protein
VKSRDDTPDGFLSRWARRKAAVRAGTEVEPTPAPQPNPLPAPGERGPEALPASLDALPGRASEGEVAAAETPPPPTLDEAATLTKDSDFTRFIGADVTPEVKNAALKKLFADPQFNVMDGLDIYIDDYGKPDPIPAAMLRQLVQSKLLGLFDDEDKDKDDKVRAAGAIPDGAAPAAEAQSQPEPTPPIADDQDAAVRLQPLDAAGPPGDPGGAGEDAGRER